MIDAEHIALFVSTAGLVWITGFSAGKAAAWIRGLLSAA